MAALFELWSPRMVGERTVAVDITPAALPKLDAPPESWVVACLSVIGIGEEPQRWKLQPSRCNFYSMFPHASDWRDRWRITWTLTCRLAAADTLDSSLSEAPMAFDQRDPSWSFDDYDDIHRGFYTMVFVADAAASDDINGAVDAVRSDLEASGANDIIPARHRLGELRVEGRVRFRSPNFSENVGAYDAILARLRRAGFQTYWTELSPGRNT